ncbi:MAG TPA: NAD(P)-dependent oxidoreductase [Rhizomicrobium sp.]|jgi:3-hydroxyisobutyrate dehydrogenase-like beta-hydroxyacid dehydrogenase|nr:NAD(P)-dependent oxidoreductase [Rhizomicrobium sp.]
MKIGFIGLGKMGAAIAENILRAGHDVTVWNRSPEPVAALEKNGACAAKTPADALQGDALFTMLASDAAMRAVGLDGAALEGAKKGLIHSNLATISVEFARELAAAHAARGLHYVASPVFGRPDAAANGHLIVVAAGASAHIETLRPIYDAIGRRLAIAGDQPEAANLFKIAGNFMIASALETLGEAIALLRKGGVDPALFHEVLTSTLFAGPVYQGYGGMIVHRKYEPAGFELKLGLKDVELARSAAQGLGMTMPLADLVREHFLDAIDDGLGEKDWSAIAGVIAKRAGLE